MKFRFTGFKSFSMLTMLIAPVRPNCQQHASVARLHMFVTHGVLNWSFINMLPCVSEHVLLVGTC